MLFRVQLFLGRRVALGQLRQTAVIFAVIVAAFLIHLQEPVEQHHLAVGAQADLAILAADLGHRAFQPGGFHLAGNRALPDQLIQPALIAVGQAQRCRIGGHDSGPDAFMRFLRVLGLVLVDPGRRGHVFLAEPRFDFGPGFLHGFGRHVDAVGPHVGDMPGLIKALRGGHRLLGTHAELAAGLLLQGRGHERRGGVAAGGLGFDRLHEQIARGQRLHRQIGGFLGGQVELVQLLAGETGQPGAELCPARRGQIRRNGPVFLRAERLDLHLALDDQAQADRLHAPRRFRSRQLAPQHRRQVEPHQIIQRAACQIGAHQFHIHFARVLHRLGDGGFGDRVEHHALDRRVLLDRAGF